MTDHDINGLTLLVEGGILKIDNQKFTVFFSGPEPWMYLWLNKPSVVLNFWRWSIQPGGLTERNFKGPSQRALRKLYRAVTTNSRAAGAAPFSPLSADIQVAVARYQRELLASLERTAV